MKTMLILGFLFLPVLVVAASECETWTITQPDNSKLRCTRCADDGVVRCYPA